MRSTALTYLADAYAPDTDRDGTTASARRSVWLVHLIALVVGFILEHSFLANPGRFRLPSWWHRRADLHPASVHQLSASGRGAFGNAIGWMCGRRGIGLGHLAWVELSRAITALGGRVQRFRAGLPARILQWRENANIIPGMIRRDQRKARTQCDGIAVVAAGSCRCSAVRIDSRAGELRDRRVAGALVAGLRPGRAGAGH